MPRTSKGKEKKMLTRNTPWDNEVLTTIRPQEILLIGEQTLPNVVHLLQEVAPMLAAIQCQWLIEIVEEKINPRVAQLSTQKCRDWLQTVNGTMEENIQNGNLQGRVLITFRTMASEIIRRPDHMNLNLLQNNSMVGSYELMQQFAKSVHSKRVIVQLQEVFVLLCGHYMYSREEYEKLCTDLNWKTPRHIQWAERFVLALVRLPVQDYVTFMNTIVLAKYPDGIPPAHFELWMMKEMAVFKKRNLQVFSMSSDEDETTADDLGTNPAWYLNQNNQSHTLCPNDACKTPWNKEHPQNPLCDALFCEKEGCESAFCFYCGEHIPYNEYVSKRPSHGRHFGKCPDDCILNVSWGWCCKRAGVRSYGTVSQTTASESVEKVVSHSAEPSDTHSMDAAHLIHSLSNKLPEDNQNSSISSSVTANGTVDTLQILSNHDSDGTDLSKLPEENPNSRTVTESGDALQILYKSVETVNGDQPELRRSAREVKPVIHYEPEEPEVKVKTGNKSKRRKGKPKRKHCEVPVDVSPGDSEIRNALKILRASKKRKFEIIEIDSDDDDEPLGSPMLPDPLRVPLYEHVRSHTDLHQELSYDKVCTCGMLLLDADVKRSPADLNLLLRRRNVSVCILRSRTETKDWKTNAEKARLGRFEHVVKTHLSTPKQYSQAKYMTSADWEALRTEGSALLDLHTDSWNVKYWGSEIRFKKWWTTDVESCFKDTVWPYENDQSTSRWHFTSGEYQTALKKGFDLNVNTPARRSIRTGFSILAGGIGSAQHVDTLFDISTDVVNPHLAVGYIIQGIKYFWALPPKGGHFARYLEFFRERLPCNNTPEVKLYRKDIYNGDIPHPFQGLHSMGWPCMSQWADFQSSKEFQNLSHFHEVFSGDRYIVVDGSWHAVVNNMDFQPAAAAFDDRWLGSGGDIVKLRVSA